MAPQPHSMGALAAGANVESKRRVGELAGVAPRLVEVFSELVGVASEPVAAASQRVGTAR